VDEQRSVDENPWAFSSDLQTLIANPNEASGPEVCLSFVDVQAGVSHHFSAIVCLREGSPIDCQDGEEAHKLGEAEAVPWRSTLARRISSETMAPTSWQA
jgi:hypothetical protein